MKIYIVSYYWKIKKQKLKIKELMKKKIFKT